MESKRLMTGLLCTVVLFLAGLSRQGFCQEDGPAARSARVSSLGVCLGISDFNQRDKYLSPYTYGGTVFASSLSYRLRSESDMQTADVFFSVGALNSDLQSRDVSQDVGLLSYSYVHMLGSWEVGNAPLGVYLGGGISSLVMNTDFNTVDNAYGTTLYDQSWYWHHSLNLVMTGEYLPGGRKSLCVRLTVPVVGLVSRPKNGHWLNADNNDVISNFGKAAVQGEIAPFWKEPVVFAAIEYTHPVSERLNLLGKYSFGYTSSRRPAEILSMGMYMNSLLAGAEWVF